MSALPGITVYAYKLVGSTWTYQASVNTNGSGAYRLDLAPGVAYHLFFKDATNTYVSEYFENAASLATGTDVTPSAGGTETADAILLGRFGDVAPQQLIQYYEEAVFPGGEAVSLRCADGPGRSWGGAMRASARSGVFRRPFVRAMCTFRPSQEGSDAIRFQAAVLVPRRFGP